MGLSIDFGYFVMESWEFLTLCVLGFSFLIWSSWRSSYRYFADKIIRQHLLKFGEASLKSLSSSDFNEIRTYSDEADTHLREAYRAAKFLYGNVGVDFVNSLMEGSKSSDSSAQK